MDILDAIRMRKSIRGYKPDPVPQAVLREILTLAGQAPSAVNNQPWEFAVVAGDTLLKIRQENVRKLNAGELPQPKHQVVGWTNDSIYRTRQVDLAKNIFQIMGILREDKVKRAEWMERGFRYFDAPAAIIIFVDSTLSEAGPLLDVGAVMQNICLAALHFGLGTCIHDQGVLYPDVVRRYAGIPEEKRLIIAISIGYPDNENIANTITSTRESIDGLTSWRGFA
ncbi:MAG: nitroreductase [Deltaproteobacteria bacterium HGW-Deltaproteobacteria-12]|jgi:nitroreductase|nr:MAG: nitroreductase [Deltaproteobacteria bacterium HGW-Deltaproteobacteria-12]